MAQSVKEGLTGHKEKYKTSETVKYYTRTATDKQTPSQEVRQNRDSSSPGTGRETKKQSLSK